MINLQKLMRAIEELGIADLDMLRDYIEWRREELLNPHIQVYDDVAIGINAVCAAIKQTRSAKTKDQIKEIRWKTSMLYLKEESNGYVE